MPIANIKRHLCLVSAQPVPNITPVLDSRLRPEHVVLLVSPDMQQKAEDLKRAMGVKTTIWSIESAWDIAHIRDRIVELLDKFGEEGWVLNATGGTKPMSMAAFEVFRGLDLPTFYVQHDSDRIIWLHPANEPALDIEDNIKIKPFLMAYGVTVGEMNRCSVPKNLRQLSLDLIQDIKRYEQPLKILNGIAAAAAQNHLAATIQADKMKYQPLISLCQLFADEGILTIEGNRVRFRDEDARSFVNGGWLEHYLFATLQQLARSPKSCIQEVAHSINVYRGDGVQNELDVVILANNTLHIIECKTKQFNDAHAGPEALYKLEALTESLGGIKAKSMLASFHTLNDATRNRAAEAGIKLCEGTQLQRLERHLEAWLC